jgi:peptidoglycan/xylan/chitin deacetylase (PgdA/CDA1 family)
MQPVRTYAELSRAQSARMRMRTVARDAAVWALSFARAAPRRAGEIRFPYYHHVFDDERAGFARQLGWMRRHGEFIRFDDAVGLLASGQRIDGRYFCVSFDDGFKNCVENALPILVEHGATAAFFLPTRYVGTDVARDRDLLLHFYDDRKALVEFMNWDDCRRLADAGMAVGSHTHSHARFAALDAAAVVAELVLSKETIEHELGRPCRHFCCPFGIPRTDFRPERDPDLARRAGYSSFATTARGAMRAGDSPFFLRRDHTLANWSDRQLRYFLLA